jgi:hypothetical protein
LIPAYIIAAHLLRWNKKVRNIMLTLEDLDHEMIFWEFWRFFFCDSDLLFVKVGFGHLLLTNLHK